ncbi:MAG: hypothetical protein LBQ93_06555 [Treponema sp.]|jgi:hypothetical protein|nr:hypothetical protein [Treponema sp.]
MKYIILVFCFLLLNCVTKKGNINYYSFIKENNINVNYLINDSEFIDNDFVTYKLTLEQKEKIMNFLRIFESTDEYIYYIVHRAVFKYDIIKIDLFYNDYDYGFYINFYSTEKITQHSKYDNINECWQTFNIAYFKMENDKIIFIGWHI